jgi:hypothetical protein
MKTKNSFTRFAIITGLLAAVLSLVAWSPPGEDRTVIVGTSNTTTTFQGIIAGYNNDASTRDGTTTYFGLVIGSGNAANLARSSMVSGSSNTTSCVSSLVTGSANMVGASLSSPANFSMAVGQLNQISSDYGWTMGYQNLVSASRGTAIGVGAKANIANGTALGRYNSTMATDDVLVIGTGSAEGTRNTAVRVTSDGSVILGRAQGDIGMGIYQ